MTEISRSALLPYPAVEVYDLINDVAAYPQFMDGCVGAEILSRDEQHMEARLDLSKAGLQYSFTTRNRLQAPHTVAMELVNGPFSEFSGVWTVLALSDEACKISLQLSFSLSSRVLAVAAKALFNPMADNLVDALVKRAHHLHQNN
ncbi:type II toxin-antitoxin system RatA family toxin [Oceanicoccus sp. KOV_DT_Chl]|uniref:type II toxin-antitoxin system RatA family toxin n=1 Tax=Oceanicoccus sp. KOV_DT_Chl TaxID=1904639 RepID=UPI000C7D5615|nr:type II toxin-antitoxin system RatA family toxin [Oceanicoccus sp. KOV_DT_Chl]